MKSLLEYLKRVKEFSEENRLAYAVAGGLSANLYRSEIRFTNDIDIVIALDSIVLVQELILSLDLKPNPIKLAYLSDAPVMGKKNSPIAIIVGQATEKANPNLDLILPILPWVSKGIERAQNNLHDFGCGPMPTITVEDLILAKIYSISMRRRSKDVDDLENIFQTIKADNLDLSFLCARIEELKLILPSELEKLAPKAIRQLSKRLKSKKLTPSNLVI